MDNLETQTTERYRRPPGCQVNLYGSWDDREKLNRVARSRKTSCSRLFQEWIRSLPDVPSDNLEVA